MPGSRVVYEKFAGYIPRQEPADRTAGGKVVHIERVEWSIVPDTATVASALTTGEVHWWGYADVGFVAAAAQIQVPGVPHPGAQRHHCHHALNQLQAPFNNPALVRRAILHVTQSDYMTAIQGDDRSTWRDGVGYFCPDTPMASDAGMENLTASRNIDALRKEVEASGYKGERIAVLGPMDIPSTKAIAEVTADLLKRLGVNLDFQAMDWATVVQRRVKQEPVDQGG